MLDEDMVENETSQEGEVVEATEESEVVEFPQPELEKTKNQLAELQARLRAVSKAYRDLQDENKAFRDRMETRARLNAELQAFEQAKAFFDPVMNLKRSLANPGDFDGLLSGLKMVEHQFQGAMTKLGLEEIKAEGEMFNPDVHEALAVMPVTDPAQDGRVINVFSSGYQVNGRTIQASQVVIGKFEKVQVSEEE